MTSNGSRLARIQGLRAGLLNHKSFAEARRGAHHEEIQHTTGDLEVSFQVENVDQDDEFRSTHDENEVPEEPIQIPPSATTSSEVATKPNTSTKIQHQAANGLTTRKRGRAQSDVYPHQQLMESLRFLLPDGKVNRISDYPAIRPILKDVLSSLCSSKGASVGAYLSLDDRSNCLFPFTRHESSNLDKGYAFGCEYSKACT